MNIAVCDDDRAICEQVIRLMKYQNPDVKATSFHSAQDLLKTKINYDIYYLDIAMESMSGIELARIVRKRQEETATRKSIIIFITGYREYMEEAFDVNAFHYLVKPIDDEKFLSVFRRACKEVSAVGELSKKHIVVKVSGIQQIIFLKDIYYIESSNKKVVLHTTVGELETYGKMEVLENELGSSFYRCHRVYLVNMEKITAYSSDSIQVINGDKLILAQKKYADFVRKYMQYAKGGGIVNV